MDMVELKRVHIPHFYYTVDRKQALRERLNYNNCIIIALSIIVIYIIIFIYPLAISNEYFYTNHKL